MGWDAHALLLLLREPRTRQATSLTDPTSPHDHTGTRSSAPCLPAPCNQISFFPPPVHTQQQQQHMKGSRGPWAVLGVVSAFAGGAIVYVHYDQQKQRTDMRKLILEEKERERQERKEAYAYQQQQAEAAAAASPSQGCKR